MSWNKNIVLLGFVLILSIFNGCAVKQAQVQNKNCCPKLFEGEDRYIMSALYLRQLGYYKDSAKLFHILYDKTDRIEYKSEEIKDLIYSKDFKNAKKELQIVLRKYPKNVEFLRFMSYIYLHQKDFKNAKKYLLKAIALKKSPKDYEFLGSIYLIEKKYSLALKYYQSAYAIKKSDELVDKIATIMFLYLDKKSEAIAYLETHSRIYGCSKIVCLKLASFYASMGDVNDLLTVYQRLFKKYKEEIFGVKIVQIDIYQKNYNDAIKFLEKHRLDDKLLLELYKIKKDYTKASKLAFNLYKKTNKIDFLAQNAMFEFEGAKVKNEKLLKDVSKKLEKVIKKSKNSIYLNYLGYLYIDYDINIDRGIKLVKEALKQNPNSPYYLDSLAWGYYKKGKCKEAYKLIENVVNEIGLKEKEVKFHFEKIRKCFKKGKSDIR